MSLVGNLKDLALADIFQIVGLSKKSGILILNHETFGLGKIVFNAGAIVAAWSDRSVDSLESLLEREQVVIPNLLATLHKSEVEPLHALKEVIVNSELSPERSYEILEAVTRHTLLGLLQWGEGTFHFDLKGLQDGTSIPEDWILVPYGISPNFIGLESARLQDETLSNDESERGDSLFDLAEELKDQFENIRGIHDAPELSPGLKVLKGMLQELHTPNVHTYITLLVLRYASSIVNRAILFDVQQSELKALGEFGITTNKDESAKLIRELKIPLNDVCTLTDIMSEYVPLKTKLDPQLELDRFLLEKLGGTAPQEIFVGPIISNQKIVGILYGDNLPDLSPIGDTEAFEIFLSVAGFALEKLRTERLSTS